MAIMSALAESEPELRMMFLCSSAKREPARAAVSSCSPLPLLPPCREPCAALVLEAADRDTASERSAWWGSLALRRSLRMRSASMARARVTVWMRPGETEVLRGEGDVVWRGDEPPRPP